MAIRVLATAVAALALAAPPAGASGVPAPASPTPAAANDPAYARQLTAIGRDLGSALGGLGAVTGMSLQYPIRPDTARKAAVVLQRAERKLRAVDRRLGQVEPPPAAARDHALLRTAVRRFAAEVKPILARVQAGYLVAAQKLQTLRATRTLARAVAGLRKQGYRLG